MSARPIFRGPALALAVLALVAVAAGAERADARDMRVHGRLMTVRPDGLAIPVANGNVVIDEEDWALGTVYDLMGFGATDADGYFDISFTWNPDLDANPDISVEFGTGLTWNHLTVQNPDGDWCTFRLPTVDDYPGSDLNMGTIIPGNTNMQRAFFIFDTAVRGRDWIIQNVSASFADATTDVNWPSNLAQGEVLDSADMEIRSVGANGTDEFSVLSELARMWYRENAPHTPSDFCNGTCDDGGCSYCVWCDEHDHDAWELGFCRWFGSYMTERLEAVTGNAPIVRIDPHLIAVGKPAPPRPVRPLSVTARSSSSSCVRRRALPVKTR